MMDGSITIIKDLFPCYKQGHHGQCNFLNLQKSKDFLGEGMVFTYSKKEKKKSTIGKLCLSMVHPSQH